MLAFQNNTRQGRSPKSCIKDASSGAGESATVPIKLSWSFIMLLIPPFNMSNSCVNGWLWAMVSSPFAELRSPVLVGALCPSRYFLPRM